VHGARDLALVCVLVDTGLRAAEVCRLRTVDVDLERLTLTVRVKGGELGQGVFCAATAHYVRGWLAWRERIARPETTTLFCGIGGLKTGTPLTTGGLRAIFRRIASRTGMTGGFSPHDLRRSMANLMTRLNSPERVTQVAGRWESTRSMRPYTEDIDLEDARRFSPVAALMGRQAAEGERQ
jgi:integrase